MTVSMARILHAVINWMEILHASYEFGIYG